MSSGNVPGVAGFSNTNLGTLLNFTPANTVNAIERYLDTLTMVRKDLDFTEKDFKDLEISNNDSFFGSKNLNENTISIGRDLSNILGLDIGDEVSITSPSGVQTLVGSLPKQKLFLITSIFESGLSEYDENIAYINLNTLEES